MTLVKLQFKPGIVKEVTPYSAMGGWIDSDLIRWRAGFPEMIGGWQKAASSSFLGVCRGMHPWTALSGTEYIAIGTHLKYYIYEDGGFTDITPIRSEVTLGASPFATVNGTNTVTVTHAGHGATAGDYVTFSGATAVGGIEADQLNTEHEIITVVDANSYTIEVVGDPATSTTSGGGAAVDASYQISVGLNSTVTGPGWGAGVWGRGTWGSATDISATGAQLRLWTQDNWGEDLFFAPRNGPLYYWDSSAGGPAELLSTVPGAFEVPTVTVEVAVTEYRHGVAFGCNEEGSATQDKMLIRWSDQERLHDWEAIETNQASFFRLTHGSEIITQLATKEERLIWTDASLWTMRYVGAPYIYGFNLVAHKYDIIGPNAKTVLGDVVFWMGTGAFYTYSGQVNRLPCSLEDFVFTDINPDQLYKVFACTNTAHNEVWFFYPSGDSEEVDRYVKFNVVDQAWDHGASLVRTAWIDRSIFSFPIATSVDSYLYYQEFGLSDGSVVPAAALPAYITSAPLELGEGEDFVFVSRLIPDMTFRDSTAAIPAATVTLIPRDWPGGDVGTATASEIQRSVAVPVEKFTTKADLRLRCRQLQYKVANSTVDCNWRVGIPRLDVRADGRRA